MVVAVGGAGGGNVHRGEGDFFDGGFGGLGKMV